MTYLVFAVLGLGAGAANALVAIGIVIGYRGSGVVNFAQGGMAMYAAYVYFELRGQGRYLLPVPGLPSSVQVGPDTGLATAPSMVLAIATAALLGLLLDALVLRPLRHAPTLAKVVATVGVLLMLQAIVVIRFGTTVQTVQTMLPKGSDLSIAGTRVPNDRLFLAAMAIVLALCVWLLSRYTKLGLATRAAAENEQGAIVLGYSPHLLSGISWTFAGALAGVAGILVSPITNLTPGQFSLLITPALAAALIGRFESIWVVTITALVMGMAQSVLTNLPSRFTWLPSTGLADALPLVVIIAVMFLAGRTVPNRESILNAVLPPVPQSKHPFATGLPLVGVAVLLLFVVPAGYRLAMINSLIAAIACLSLVVVTGLVGQISMFQLTLAGICAYLLAELSTKIGIPFPLSALLAALGATVVGLIGAVPALRVRGVNLAVITLAAGWAVQQVIFNDTRYTGGVNGATVSGPKLFGLDLSFDRGATVARPAFGLVVLVILALLGMGFVNLRRSETGKRMLAVRANERAAAAAGIDIRRTKLLAFGLAAFIAGLAGALMAYEQMQIASSSFDVFLSLSLLAIAYIGGSTSVTGAVLGGTLTGGGIVFYILQSHVVGAGANAQNIQQLIAGLGLVLTAIFNPIGIAGGVRLTVGALRRRFRRVPATGGPAAPAPDQQLAAAGERVMSAESVQS